MKLHGVHPTAESIPTVCIIPPSRVFQILMKKNPPCAPHRRVNLRGVHPTAETISRCASYRGDNLCCVHHTVESNCTPGVKIELLSLVAFKGTIRTNPSISEHIYHERKDLKYIKC